MSAVLEPKRLILRTWKDEDLPLFIAMNQDPEVMQFYPALYTTKESTQRFEDIKRHQQEHGFCKFAVELKSTREFIGMVGMEVLKDPALPFTPCVEIGWRLRTECWNQGYATEAARAVLHAAFTQYHLKEVVAFTAVINTPSRRVMEKIGMTHHPQDDFDHPAVPLHHPLRPHFLYRIDRTSYIEK